MSYEDIYNMTLNEVREGTLKLRNPTKSNVSLSNGKDKITIDIKKLILCAVDSKDYNLNNDINKYETINNQAKDQDNTENDQRREIYNTNINIYVSHLTRGEGRGCSTFRNIILLIL